MKIVSVEQIPVSLRVRPDLAIVSAAGQHPHSHYLFVKITTDEGLSGWGEATLSPVWSGESQGTAQHVIRDLLAPLLIGKDPRHVTVLADAMDRVVIANPFTKAAIEMALIDLVSRMQNLPASLWLGGQRREARIRLKFSIGAFTPGEAARVARHALSLGLTAVKVKVGLDVNQDIARVEAVRREVGSEVRVAVDANAGWTESEARRAIPHLERLGVNALEQPLRRGDFRGSARLRQCTSIPIMLDEGIFTRQDALEAIRADACDLISVYPGKNGGILRSLDIANMAATAGLRCIIGSNLEMDLGSAAMLHLATAMPALDSEVDHDIIGPLYYEKQFTSTPIRYEKGFALLEDRDGLGVAIDREE